MRSQFSWPGWFGCLPSIRLVHRTRNTHLSGHEACGVDVDTPAARGHSGHAKTLVCMQPQGTFMPHLWADVDTFALKYGPAPLRLQTDAPIPPLLHSRRVTTGPRAATRRVPGQEDDDLELSESESLESATSGCGKTEGWTTRPLVKCQLAFRPEPRLEKS